MTGKLSHESSSLDNLVSSFVAGMIPPQNLSEAVVDHDYSLLAVKCLSEIVKDLWVANIAELKKMEALVADPIRSFLQTDVRNFKEARRQLEQTQRTFDQLQTRYSAQAKTKEPSALREDAFQVHESRKAYLKSSMDFSTSIPQLRMSLDRLLIKVFSEQSQVMRGSREGSATLFARWGSELERIRNWSREVELGEQAFREELHNARKQMEETAEQAGRPSRELEDYAQSATGPLATKGPSPFAALKPNMATGGKQGWLNAKTTTVKSARAIWLRRWFYVKNGVFGWLVQGSRSGGVEESDRIGVLLCGLKPAVSEERRFCFEVKTKNTTIVLQADSQGDLTEWLAAFDAAKQKALEDPIGTAFPSQGPSAKQTFNSAFAISPPSALEFAASSRDASLMGEDNYDRSASLSLGIPNDSSSLAHRGSFDVSSGRRSTAIEGDGNRDHTGKIMQKLDPRKPLGGPQNGMHNGAHNGALGTPSSSVAAGGIASLISANHMTLPLASTLVAQGQSQEAINRFDSIAARSNLSSVLKSLPPSTLGPSTLANPPNATNLSVVAVMVNGEKGIGIGQDNGTGGTPSGPLANFWGSFAWGYINRPERGRSFLSKQVPSSPAYRPVDDQLSEGKMEDVLESADTRTDVSHRKTISLDGDVANSHRAMIAPLEIPSYYPALLKHHDAQFRLLFPGTRGENKVLLVFRAMWNPNEQQEFTGRAFVTAKAIYFYSHHLGLVLTTSLSLASISEVTAAHGRECDFLFLHLKDLEHVDHTRVTVKIFIEPLKLLQQRLNFLVQNANSDEPRSLEIIMKTMIKFEFPYEDEKSPSNETWEDSPGATPSLPRHGSQRMVKDLRTRVLIDQDSQGIRRGTERDALRFKLPSRPVDYIPMGMATPVVERDFSVSPKALFHLLFGDRSAVWQLLYHERQAHRIRQGPWIQQEPNYLRRIFEYRIEYVTLGLACQADVVDVQTIDASSDHLCYVVTDRKTPWHLPYSETYTLLSKIVITHVAKSKCKLAIYTKVDWTKQPRLVWRAVQQQAKADLKMDALDLVDLVSEQVRRLGIQNNTKKAVQIFGAIGHEAQTMEFKGSDCAVPSRARHTRSRKTILQLVFKHFAALLENVVTTTITSLVVVLKWAFRTFNANSLILLILMVSVLSNLLFFSRLSSAWWQERRAEQFMRSLGIGHDLVISKSISLTDLDLGVLPGNNSIKDVNTLW